MTSYLNPDFLKAFLIVQLLNAYHVFDNSSCCSVGMTRVLTIKMCRIVTCFTYLSSHYLIPKSHKSRIVMGPFVSHIWMSKSHPIHKLLLKFFHEHLFSFNSHKVQ